MNREFESWLHTSPAPEAQRWREAVAALERVRREVARARSAARKAWHEVGGSGHRVREGAITQEVGPA
jgi:heme oxygenase